MAGAEYTHMIAGSRQEAGSSQEWEICREFGRVQRMERQGTEKHTEGYSGQGQEPGGLLPLLHLKNREEGTVLGTQSKQMI